MRIRIVGHDPPGRSFCSDGELLTNVHVAVQVGREPFGAVPGDSERATWSIDVRAVPTDDGIDLRGPAVHGKRGDRFLYLTWGERTDHDDFTMFRRAKLMIGDIDPALLEAACAPGALTLTATVDLRDERGHPRCARVRPPAVQWRLEP